MGQAEKRYFVTLEINGTQRTVDVEARKLLVHLIREDFGLTGTHVGCDTSQCGACTVEVRLTYPVAAAAGGPPSLLRLAMTLPNGVLDVGLALELTMTFIHERKRLTVEELAADCLDVRDLNRKGLLKERTVTSRPLLRWPEVETMRTDRYIIQVNFCDRATPQSILLSWTPCNFGSYRPWMLCPHCRKRVARLFEGMSGFFCRACNGNPPYESQLRNEKARAYLKAYRLRQRLGGSKPVKHPIPERPYRMWRRTYNRIVAEIERLERSLLGSRVVKRAPLWIRPLCY